MVRLAEDLRAPTRRFSMQERLMGYPLILTPFAIVLPTVAGCAAIGAALGAAATGQGRDAFGFGLMGWLVGGWVFSLAYNPEGLATETRAGADHREPFGSRVVAAAVILAAGIVAALAFVSWGHRAIWAVAVGVSLSWLLMTVSALRRGMPRGVLLAVPLSVPAGLLDAVRILVACLLVLLGRSLIE